MMTTISFGTPEYDEAVALRYEILRRPLGLDYTAEQLAEEWNQIHIAAFDQGGRIVGYLNLTPYNNGQVKMRQVAVATAEQGRGVGKAMVVFSEEQAREHGFEKIVLHARDTAVPFYLKLGYTVEGDEFEEVTIPHYKMYKKLTDQ
jgi:predicted GNAT family N-acyltransferase